MTIVSGWSTSLETCRWEAQRVCEVERVLQSVRNVDKFARLPYNSPVPFFLDRILHTDILIVVVSVFCRLRCLTRRVHGIRHLPQLELLACGSTNKDGESLDISSNPSASNYRIKPASVLLLATRGARRRSRSHPRRALSPLVR